MIVTPVSHCGIHTWTGNVQFHLCAHAAIVEEEDPPMYLEQGSAAFNAKHFYEGMTAVVTTRGLLRQGDFCDKLHLNPCLYSSLHIAPRCIK